MGKVLEVSRWGVGWGGSLCMGPARSPALAASVRTPEGCRGAGTEWWGRAASHCVSFRPAVCPRAPLPSPARCVPLYPPPGPDPLSTTHPCPPLPTRAVLPCPGPDPFSGARPAGSARGMEGAVRSLFGSRCGGLGASRIPVGAARVKWDTGGTRSHSCCVGWALAAAPGQLCFSQRSGIESLWLKAGVS